VKKRAWKAASHKRQPDFLQKRDGTSADPAFFISGHGWGPDPRRRREKFPISADCR
jgi:hypothetical protein